MFVILIAWLLLGVVFLMSLYKKPSSGSSDKGRSQKTPTSPLSPSSQKLLQFDLPGTSLERSKSSAIVPPATTGFNPTAAFTDVNKIEMASTPGK